MLQVYSAALTNSLQNREKTNIPPIWDTRLYPTSIVAISRTTSIRAAGECGPDVSSLGNDSGLLGYFFAFHQSRDIAGDDIDFEVDPISDLQPSQDRCSERGGNERNGKAILGHRGDR